MAGDADGAAAGIAKPVAAFLHLRDRSLFGSNLGQMRGVESMRDNGKVWSLTWLRSARHGQWSLSTMNSWVNADSPIRRPEASRSTITTSWRSFDRLFSRR